MPPVLPGVTFVVPVHNGARWLPRVLDAIEDQEYPGPVEVIMIDDASSDGSLALLETYAGAGRIRLMTSRGRGAGAALNTGIRAARYPLIAQVDQDVIVQPGWLATLAAPFDDRSVAATQGHYVAARDAGPWSRVTALDLRHRYGAIDAGPTNHVCTGNSVYRADALQRVGLFDETMGYGYDNDLSYRLAAHGYRLVFCPAATSVHIWREGVVDYARQQYGLGYGRLDLVARHRHRYAGDDVSPLGMMLHAPVMLSALALLASAVVLRVIGGPARGFAGAGSGLIAVLALERAIAGLSAALRFRDPAGFLFAPAHLLRDAAWAAAIIMWLARRVLGRPPRAGHSMAPRTPEEDVRP